jgi:hypothetical protein
LEPSIFVDVGLNGQLRKGRRKMKIKMTGEEKKIQSMHESSEKRRKKRSSTIDHGQ